MSEFYPGICWLEFRTATKVQADAVINAGFKAIRLFFNMRDLPYTPIENVNQSYINHCFAHMPNPYHTWTFEGNPNPNITGEPMRAGFDFCKANGWLPIVCMGTSEEEVQGEWIGRVPANWEWIKKFITEFAIYLRDTYKFKHAVLECFNEPYKIWGNDYKNYCSVAYLMGQAWKKVSGYKFSVFNDDLLRQDLLDGILTDTNLMAITDYIGTHIGVGSEDDEWEGQMIRGVKDKIARYPHIRQAVTELSFNGIWDSRMKQLIDNGVAMYGIIGAIRNKRMGTSTRIDDIWLYGDNSDIKCTSQAKRDIITKFNNKYYKPYEGEDWFDMLELNYVKSGSVNEETKAVQQVLASAGYVVAVTGKCDEATVKSIKDYQREHGLAVDGWVGRITWESFFNNIAMAAPIFCTVLVKTARFR